MKLARRAGRASSMFARRLLDACSMLARCLLDRVNGVLCYQANIFRFILTLMMEFKLQLHAGVIGLRICTSYVHRV